MSIECGYAFFRKPEGKPPVYAGELQNLASLPAHLNGEFFLVPHTSKRGENSPDHAIKLKTHNGNFVHLGNAWTKKFKDGSGIFHSLTIDGPGVAAPIYVSMFPDDEQPPEASKKEPLNWTVKWGRPRGGKPQAQAAGPSALDDEIPYS